MRINQYFTLTFTSDELIHLTWLIPYVKNNFREQSLLKHLQDPTYQHDLGELRDYLRLFYKFSANPNIEDLYTQLKEFIEISLELKS